MKKNVLWMMALTVLLLISMAGCTPPNDQEGESESLLNVEETQDQFETTPQINDETEPVDLGASGVEIWEDEVPTNSASGGDQTDAQGGTQGQAGSQGNQGGKDAPPDVTEPNQSQQPTEPESGEKPTAPDPEETTYEDYLAMTPEEQEVFFDSFPSMEAFMDWHNAAKAEYEDNEEGIIVDGGNINIGDYIETP